MNTIRAIRGMNDILPDETRYWQFLEDKVRGLMAAYGYAEIRLPVVEQTELFRRGVAKLGVDATRCLYVGDVYSIDVLGARAAGLDALLFDRTGRYQVDAPTVRSFAELAERLT